MSFQHKVDNSSQFASSRLQVDLGLGLLLELAVKFHRQPPHHHPTTPNFKPLKMEIDFIVWWKNIKFTGQMEVICFGPVLCLSLPVKYLNKQTSIYPVLIFLVWCLEPSIELDHFNLITDRQTDRRTYMHFRSWKITYIL